MARNDPTKGDPGSGRAAADDSSASGSGGRGHLSRFAVWLKSKAAVWVAITIAYAAALVAVMIAIDTVQPLVRRFGGIPTFFIVASVIPIGLGGLLFVLLIPHHFRSARDRGFLVHAFVRTLAWVGLFAALVEAARLASFMPVIRNSPAFLGDIVGWRTWFAAFGAFLAITGFATAGAFRRYRHRHRNGRARSAEGKESHDDA
jgi:hypothetical protein